MSAMWKMDWRPGKNNSAGEERVCGPESLEEGQDGQSVLI